MTDEARDLLERCRVARLATADRHGRPHVIPFCYAIDGDTIVFVVDDKPKAAGRTLKRLRNIAENPAVCLVADVWDEDWSKLAYVMIHGEASIDDDPGAFSRALGHLRARYPQYRDMPLAVGRNALVRIRPTQVHHWRAG